MKDNTETSREKEISLERAAAESRQILLKDPQFSPSIDISLELAKRQMRATTNNDEVVQERSWDPVFRPVDRPHCHAWATETAFIHICSNLASQTLEAKCSTDTHSAITEAVT